MEPGLARDHSIGNASFADHLREGLAAAARGDQMLEDQDDRLEDITADFPHLAVLKAMPAATQAVEDAGANAEGFDDRKLEHLQEKHASLHSKSCRMKDLWAKKAGFGDHDPYAVLGGMHATVSAMEAGQDKQHAVEMMNAVVALFSAAREHEGTRQFLSELFSTQAKYYEEKKEKRAVNEELAMLNKLYNDQEEATMLANLKKAREERDKMLQEKGMAKAAKDAAKTESGGKRKKTE